MSSAPASEPSPDMLKAALSYAELGFAVFPVHSAAGRECSCRRSNCQHCGKHPRTPHGFKDATTGAAQIKEWWRNWPDANIGVLTGAASGLLVLDIDPRHGGDRSLDDLISKHGRLPETAEQLTGGGGRHICFRYPRIPVGKLFARGIDLKGDRGYIIGAPSIHESGNRYRWRGADGPKALLHRADPPGWLLNLIAKRQDDRSADRMAGLEKWGQGNRNTGLMSLAGAMRRRGMTQSAIEAALLEENRRHCGPPLPEAEILSIAASAARYPPADAVVLEEWTDLIPFNETVPVPLPPRSVPAWLGEMARAVAESTETPFDLAALLGVAVASACVAGRVEVSPEPGYSETLNLYTCAAMESGNRKTAVFNCLLQPLVEWEQQAIEQIQPIREKALSDRRILEARIERLRRKAACGKDQGALIQEIRELEGKLPILPAIPRCFVDDCTPERLASLMAEQDERMAVFSDEGGVFDILAGRYSKGIPNLDLWLKGHSVSPVRVDRADRYRPPVILNRPHLTVGVSPQPDVLASLKDKPGFRGRGLLARFLYGLPTSPLGHRRLEVRPVPSEVEQRYRAGIHRLIELNPKKQIEVGLTESAYDDWKDFQRAVEVQFRDGGRLQYLKDWGSKLPGAAIRLAGVFHMVEQGGRRDLGLLIPRSTIQQALDLAACLISHVQCVFALMDRDSAVDAAKKLVVWAIRRGQPSFTIRDCFRAHQGRFERVDAMLPILSLLEQHGYIRRVPQCSAGGRKPSEICEVNPAVLTEENRG